MRRFNSSGPCHPQEHYTVLREALLEQGRVLVEQGRYFTIFAPRQAGKTTYFHILLERLKTEGQFTPIWISFENLKTYTKEEFYDDMAMQLEEELSEYHVTIETDISNLAGLVKFFKHIQQQVTLPLVIFIDEFEGIPDIVLSELMHTFRKMYHRKKYSRLHSIILIGVSTISELILSSASPFNIVDELQIPYFTHDEVRELIRQYVTESGQPVEEEVINAIYANTQGQPGLVGGLCQYIVEQVATDRAHPVTMEDFYPTLTHFIKERRDTNIKNIVEKAREKREFILRLLFSDTPIEFMIDNPDMDYLSAHGVIHNVDGWVEIPVPLYRKRLINTFHPIINGEAEYYSLNPEGIQQYVTPTGLNLHALLDAYRRYIRRRGFRAFDTEHLKEGAWHYSLDGFINFFIKRLGGHTLIETPTSRGRTDLLILYRRQKYIIETKIFTDNAYFHKGKRQLAAYLTSEGLDEGYYVVFSNKHREQDDLYSDEEVKGKRIYTSIIRTNFERATEQ